MNEPPVKRDASRSQAGFPLASLALLITVFAAALACTDLNRWERQYAWLSQEWPWRLVGVVGGSAVFGGLIGITQLFFLASSGRTRWIAPLAGIVTGLIGALILIAPGPIWRTLFAISVMLVTAVL